MSDDDGGYSSGPPQISSLVAYSKGFACACGPGVVYLYEKTDDKEFFKKIREIKVCNLCTCQKSFKHVCDIELCLVNSFNVY